MAKEWAKPFYNSHAWAACREAYIKKRISIDGGMCEVCHNYPGYIVHHKVILTKQNIDDVNVTLNHDNLMYECKACHDEEEEHFVGRNRRAESLSRDGGLMVLFSPDGQPIDNRLL